jgi:hypothetical protein
VVGASELASASGPDSADRFDKWHDMKIELLLEFSPPDAAFDVWMVAGPCYF